MKNNKGFTLIELLAVMVILAIIALIATPVVMGVITNARKAAAVDSAYGIIKAAEAHYASKLLESGGTFTETTLKLSSDVHTETGGSAISNELSYKGTKATGTIKIDANGTITFTPVELTAPSSIAVGKILINGFACTLSAADGKVTCGN